MRTSSMKAPLGSAGAARTVRTSLALAALLALSGCGTLSNGFLNPAGTIALQERQLFTIVCIVLLFVIGPVLLLTPIIAWHYRLSNTKSAFRPQWGFSWILEGLIWVPPTLIVVGLAFVLCKYTVRLDPYRPVPGESGQPLVIDVVALDWKWLFIYPEQHIATVNQLMLPAGRPISFNLTSGTVMQSLLMPRLAGQIYAMAGMRTKLNFNIAEPGSYAGENVQYNGDGFPRDKFQIYAMTGQDFAAWVKAAQADKDRLDGSVYQRLSRESVLDNPRTFGQVEPDLFTKILQQSIIPGYVAQHGESPPPGAHSPNHKNDPDATQGRTHA